MRNFCRVWLVGVVFVGLGTFGRAQILPPGARPTRVATGFNFTEGPLDDGMGGILFTNLVFNNLSGSDIIRYDIAAGTSQTLVPNSGGANGLYRDHDGFVISMDGATQQVSKRSPANLNTIVDVLAEEWDGKPFNSPNDLVIDASGGIYFTDPDYNNNRNQPESVYYIDDQGTLSRILTGFPAAARPNGIMLSLDEQTLYVALQAHGQIRAYDVTALGIVSNERTFANSGPDGMTLDRVGNLYGAVQNNISAWDPQGNKLFDIPMPQSATNVTFGPDDTTLYITAGNSLYQIGLNVPLPPDADFNADARIDARDFLVWQRGNTSGTTLEQGDANHDGTVNELDLNVWMQQYGQISETGFVAVPEPTTLVLLSAGILLLRRQGTEP